MIVTRTPDREPTVSPEELAAAMRRGLEARRFFRKPAETPLQIVPFVLPDGSLLPRLLDHGGVVGMPAPAHPGVKGKVVRALRKVVKNADAKITADYGHGEVDLEEISLLAAEKCHAQITHVDARRTSHDAEEK